MCGKKSFFTIFNLGYSERTDFCSVFSPLQQDAPHRVCRFWRGYLEWGPKQYYQLSALPELFPGKPRKMANLTGLITGMSSSHSGLLNKNKH